MAAKKGKKLDPATFAVLIGRIDTIVNSTIQIEQHIARSILVGECRDASGSLADREGNLVSISEGILSHCAAAEFAIKTVVKAFEADARPGDLYLFNHPYQGNTHIGDINIVAPVFFEGEIMFWMVNRSHPTDVGAVEPMSVNHFFKDKWEEGIHFAPLRIHRDYKEIKDVMAIFFNNFRFLDLWYGDHLGQVAAVRSGERMILELCKKYGRDVILQFIEEYNDYADRLMTEEIRKLPKGSWTVEEWHDPIPGLTDPKGIRLVVKMTIDPDEATMTFDLSESDDTIKGGTNTTYAGAFAGIAAATFHCLDPRIPKIHGAIKHLKVIVRPGSTAGGPIFPTSTSLGTTEIPNRLGPAVYRAMNLAAPEKTHGAGTLMNICCEVGVDRRKGRNRPFGDLFYIGMGGGPSSIGYDGWPSFTDNSTSGVVGISSIEIMELRMPILFHTVFMRPDSAGAGKWRGGIGSGYEYHVYEYGTPEDYYTIPVGDGQVYPPPGFEGGKPGKLAAQWIVDMKTGKKVRDIHAASRKEIVLEGQAYHLESNGGGGYGDPLERDPELVRWDAREGIISDRAARDDYGVVLNTKLQTYEVDYKATEELRRKLKKNNTGVTK